jgi:hypothetical protein
MDQEDKTIVNTDKSREFGAMGELLRELQKEEMEISETSSVETPEENIIPEGNINQNMVMLMKEINESLKEIAEMQKSILEELKRRPF